VIVKRLRPGDEELVERLAEREPHTALLADERTVFIVALEGDEPIGFVFGYDLPRRHGEARIFLVYEIEVRKDRRGRGVGTQLMAELRRICRDRGIERGFVLADADNVVANALYERTGGVRSDVVMWDFRYADD
jgi:GNAT superfamily N-acetyltransferase